MTFISRISWSVCVLKPDVPLSGSDTDNVTTSKNTAMGEGAQSAMVKSGRVIAFVR